jgi:hypothetical protein
MIGCVPSTLANTAGQFSREFGVRAVWQKNSNGNFKPASEDSDDVQTESEETDCATDIELGEFENN